MRNYIKLKQIIDADASNAALTDLAIAQKLNVQTTSSMRADQLTARKILKILGATAGAAFLDSLNSVAPNISAVNWIMQDILQGGVDIADVEVQAMLTYLVDLTFISQTDVDKLNADATVQELEILRAGFNVVDALAINKAKAGIV